jgi:ankyrin repeat protein
LNFRSFLQDFDMNMSDYDGRTALHLTCAEGHLEAVKFLLEVCKVHPEPKDRFAFSQLHIGNKKMDIDYPNISALNLHHRTPKIR